MYQVGEFEFESLEQAQKAQKEFEGIKYIKAQTRMDDPEVVLKLYNKLILKDIFSTPLGYQFLYELREYLKTSGKIRTGQVHRIPVAASGADSVTEKKNAIRQNRKLEEVQRELAEARRLNKNKRDYKKLFRGALIFSIACAVMIIGMFIVMALSDDNINIINYENKIVNKYEAWEQELEEREAAVSEREERLGVLPGSDSKEDKQDE